MSGARGQAEPLSEAAKTTTSDGVLEFDGAWDRAKVHQKDLDERRNSWPSWRQSHTGNELRTDDERDRCRRLRRLNKRGAGTEASISQNGTTTLGDSRSDEDAHHRVTERPNVQQGKQHEDEYSIHSRINAYTTSSCRGVRV